MDKSQRRYRYEWDYFNFASLYQTVTKLFQGILVKFLIWRIKHVNNKTFMLVLAGLIGVISGFAAVILKETVHLIQYALTSDFDIKYANYFYLGFYQLASVRMIRVA